MAESDIHHAAKVAPFFHFELGLLGAEKEKKCAPAADVIFPFFYSANTNTTHLLLEEEDEDEEKNVETPRLSSSQATTITLLYRRAQCAQG